MALTATKIKPKEAQSGARKSRLPLWWVRMTHWEYWPFHVLYFPLYFYTGWLMLKARSFLFFSASNPGIEYGGMLGESKIKILDRIPARYKPKTCLLSPDISLSEIEGQMKTLDISYPCILKPDIGERGWGVRKIGNRQQLENYLSDVSVPFLLQECIESPLEMGVFYVRHPSEKKGKITSIVLKEMMTVTGDGSSTVDELLQHNPRAAITYPEIVKTSGDVLSYVPEADQTIEVVPIGNHCRGTTFLDGNYLISKKIRKAIEAVALDFEGFYFGRFDLRCDSIEALERGDYKVLELNGCGAEPAHIYQPGYSLLQAYKDLIYHLDRMYDIAVYNHQQGIPYMTFSEGVALVQFLRRYNRHKNQ